MNISNMKKFLLVPAVVLVVLTPAFAQKQTPPEGTAPKPFTVPKSETYALANGMKVTLVPYGIIPKAAVSVMIEAGSVNEGKGHGGVASITGELLKEGTAQWTSQQLGEETARMGSSLGVSVNADRTDVEMDVLQEFAPDAVKVLADVLEHPRLPES